MGILHTTACLLFSALPQSGPGPDQPAPTAGPVFEFAQWFPPDTTALFVLEPLHEQWDELAATGLGRILADRTWLQPLAAQFAAGIGDLETRSGITAEQWLQALQNGMAFGWTGFDAGGAPQWQGVIGLGSAEDAFARSLREWAEGMREASPSSARAELWGGTEVWEMQGATTAAFAVRDGMLWLGSSRAEVEGMLRRSNGEDRQTLAAEPGFRAFAGECTTRPVWGCYLRVARLARQVVQQIPERQATALRAIRALRLDKLERVTVAVHLQDGEFVERLRATFPAPQEGLLGTLMGRPGRIDEDLARWVPEGATSFGFSALDFAALTRDFLTLLQEVEPGAAAMAAAGLEQTGQRLGIDLQEDLLATMGDHFASMQWPGSDGESRMAMAFALRDDVRFENAWDKLRKALPIQPITGNRTGQKLYRIQLPWGTETLTLSAAVHRGFLLCANSDAALREVLDRDEALPNAAVRAFLAELTPDTTYAGRTDLAAAARGIWPGLQAALGPAGSALDPALAEHLGVLVNRGDRTDEGFVMESRSPVGSLQGIAVLGVVSSIALPSLAAQSAAPAPARQDTAAVRARLQGIRTAQLEFRAAGLNDEDGDGQGEFGTLDELLGAGLMQASLLGRLDPDGTVTSDEFLTTVLLPPTTDGREQQFVAIAWPAGEKPGPVYCALADGPVLVNEILAGTAGMTAVDPRDVFLGGLFGSELTPGWRPVERPVTRATAVTAGDDSPASVLRAVEESGDPAQAHRVLPLLQHEDPEIASRAAWLLGQLKAKDAVPQLCDLVKDRFEDDVRKHAMAALVRIGDRRSLQASVTALGDTDPTVRSLAAANLGKIRSREAVQHLLGLIEDRAGEDAKPDDVVAALLALNDIGDTEALLPAAGAFSETPPHPETGAALAFLFQELSPRMQPEDEASVLLAVLDHPDPMLRRYAIQRLGELRLPNTARALEGRLAAEDEALQPLVRVSLAAVRGETMQEQDWLARAEQIAKRFWNKAQARWQQMDDKERMMVAGGAGGILLLLLLFSWARSRARRKRRAEEMAAMVAPSEGFEDEELEPVFEGDYGEGEPAVGEGEYFEEEYAAETEEEATFGERF